jgi:hypothetical protein
MVTGLEILAAVETCANITVTIWHVIKDMKDMKADQLELNYKLADDSLFLKNLSTYVKGHSDRFSHDLRDQMTTWTIILNDVLSKLEREIDKRANTTTLDHVKWPLIKPGIEAAESYLDHWIKRVNQNISNLPPEVRRPFLETFASADYKQKSNPFSPLVAAENMRTRLGTPASDSEYQNDVSRFRDDSLNNPDQTHYFEPDLIPVPPYFPHDRKTVDDFERRVVELVAVLSHADTNRMHILKACKYTRFFAGEIKAVFQYGIIYEKPGHVTEAFTLKELIEPSRKFVC